MTKIWLLFAAAALVSAQGDPSAQVNPPAQPAAAVDNQPRPAVLIREMKLDPGMTVADIGTGIGNMLALLSHRVGPTGRVLAEDTEDDFLAAAKDVAESQSLRNITFIKRRSAANTAPPRTASASR